MDYSTKDIELIMDWNKYFEDIVNYSNIPSKTKKKMLDERIIHNSNNTYYLNYKGYRIDFMKFEQWLLQRERDKKLTQLGV
jgi:hypothetical protein